MSRLIEKLDEGEHLQPSDDGYVVYWDSKGYLTASHLREIADELDRRNKTWHEQVMQDVGPPMPQIKPLVWHSVSHESIERDIVARSNVGNFYVTFNFAGIWKSWFGNDCTGMFNSLDEAKATCQSEYERRVRECLE